MSLAKILWVDDEIDLLKPHFLFLESKGYELIAASNGYDAIEELEENPDIDIIFLDESMPGMTGLETLPKLKMKNPTVPIVMITKNEAENVMEEAIGAQISDYLIKPVNPNQILLTLKRIVEKNRLVREKTSMGYQQEFRNIFMRINSGLSFDEWVDVYKEIVSWELKIDASNSHNMGDILATQKSEANAAFSKFIVKNYIDWHRGPKEDRPVMSPDLMRDMVFPNMQEGIPTIMVLLDNLRYDQWKIIEPIIAERFNVIKEETFCSILPTTTQYSRNAIFAGMMPGDIAKHHREYWKNDADEGGKNNFEDKLLENQVKRIIRRDIKLEYIKVTSVKKAKQLVDNAHNYLDNDLTVIVYNFIDMLSHARTEMEVLKELAGDEKAYRSLTRSWFLHSPLWATLQKVANKNLRLIIATDHGTIRVKKPSRIIGDKETTTNLRYKAGRNLRYEAKDVLAVRKPADVGLPTPNISSSFVFAIEDFYFLYPNNYNKFNNYFRNTFQHGGISLEEMICPLVVLDSKMER